MEKTKNDGKESLFFSVGNRLEVVESILGRFRSLTPVVVVSGEAGSGKTSVCCAVEKHMVVTHRVIFFESAPQSFDDFIALLADKLKCNVEAISGIHDAKTTLEYCLEKLAQSPEKLLLLCDDAEEIYLATLERILKFISRCKEGGVDTQLLLAGTPRVLEAYQGLATNDIAKVEISLFVLDPLCKNESGLFYEQLLGQKIQEEGKTRLSADVLEMLYSKTEGNMKKISHIASRVAQTDESDGSFFSLLSEIEGEERLHSKKMKRQVATQRKQQKAKNRARLVVLSWVLGFVAIAACGVFYFGQQSKVETFVAPVEQQPDEKHNVQDMKDVAVQSPTLPTNEDQASAVTTVVAESNPNLHIKQKTTPFSGIASDLAVAVPTPTEKKNDVDKKEQVDLVAVKEGIPPPVQVVIQDEVVSAPVSAPVKEASVELVKDTVVVLPNPKITQEPKKQIVETTVIQAKTTLLKPQQKRIVAPITSPLPKKITAEQLYAQSLAAGESWKNRDSGLFYTLQLMVLTSDNAAEHLQNYLNQGEYRTVVDNFHVLKRNQGESALLVFYGEYVSAEQARAGRDSLPAFLQKHKPYLITIDGALEKAGL